MEGQIEFEIPILKVVNLMKTFGGKDNIVRAVDGISFEVMNGEFVGIMGASGSGKTTLLNCIATIDNVTSGDIFIDNNNITNFNCEQQAKFRKNKLGFIFQEYNLLDNLTGYENISLALSLQGIPIKKIDQLLKAISKNLRLENFINKYPYQMSGGEKQRIATARAMTTNPAIILADEPTGALDSNSAKRLMELFAQINIENKSTILMVTHDANSASYCNRIIFIKDGRIIQQIVKNDMERTDFLKNILEVLMKIDGEI